MWFSAAEAPLADDPRGKEQQREGLLGLIVEQDPAGERGDGPHENGGRPVFLDIEDLADERDGCAGGDGADRMQRGGEARNFSRVTAPPR